VGEKLLPGFNDTVTGVGKIQKAFGDIVKAGGLDPLFTALNTQGGDIETLFAGIAKALPDAFAGIDFTNLLSGFGDIKKEIGSLFDGLDPTKPEDLKLILQAIVDFMGSLASASAGVIEGLKPLFTGIATMLADASASGTGVANFVGEVAGIGSAINKVLPFLDLIATTLSTVGGALAVLSSTGANTSLLSLARGAGAAALALGPVGLALAGVATAITIGIGEYNDYTKATKASTTASELATKQEAAKKEELRQASVELGKTITNYKDLKKAQESGKIVFDEVDKLWRKAPAVVRDYDKEVADAATKSITWKKTTTDVVKGMKDLGLELDLTTGKVKTTKKADYDLKAAIEKADKAHKSFRIVLKDGVKTVETFGVQTTKTKDAIEAEAKATGKLTEAQRLGITEAGKLKRKMAELATAKQVQALKFKATVDVAEIQAAAKVAEAAFKSVSDVVKSTTDGVSAIFGSGPKKGDTFGFQFERQLGLSNDRADQALANATDLNNAEIDLMRAKANRLQGGTQVTIDAGNLAPELQAVMEGLINNIRIEALAEGMTLLT